MMKRILVIILLAVVAYTGYGRAQYSLLQTYGTKCQNCHVNIQGGGVRNVGGWLSRKDICLIDPKSIGLEGFYNTVAATNNWLDEMILFGFDARYQTAKWGSPEKSTRDYMLMQLSPYLVVKPTEWMELEGFYNLAYDIENAKRYPGQQVGAFSLYIKPSADLPQLRVGFFQPTLGTKYDDHTLLVKRAGDRLKSLPLVPDDYAEWGAQIDYESISWLGLSVGVFDSKNMSKITVKNYLGQTESFFKEGRPSFVFRAGVYPELGGGMTGYAGGTLLINGGVGLGSGGFYMNNDYAYIASLFANFGLSDKLAIMTEYTTSEKQWARTTDNFLVEVDYQIMEPIILFARAERATTHEKFGNNFYKINQYVLGAHVYLLPFLDLLPEYRIYDREAVESFQTQWAFQIHLSY